MHRARVNGMTYEGISARRSLDEAASLDWGGDRMLRANGFNGASVQFHNVMYLSGAPRIALHRGVEGGPRRHVTGAIKGLRAAGFQVDAFVAGDHMPASAVGEAGAVSSRRLHVPGMRFVNDGLRQALAFRNRWLLKRCTSDRSPHVIDLAYERYAMYQCLGSRYRRLGTPWVVESNGIYYQELARRHGAIGSLRMARRHEGRTYADADLVVAISEPLRQQIVAEFDIDPQRIVVVPNGVDAEAFGDPSRPAAGTVGDELVIGYVGKADSIRRPDYLIRGLARARRNGVRCRAEIIGGGCSMPRLQQTAERLGVADAVTFHGYVEPTEVPALMGRFDVGYCAPVTDEPTAVYTSPLKLYEYMAAARPVIFSGIPSVEAEMKGHGFGFRLREHSPEGVAEVIAEIDAARDRLPAMGAEAERHAHAHCTWQARMQYCMDQVCQRLEITAR